MKNRKTRLIALLVLAALLSVAFVCLIGCKKKTEPVASVPAGTIEQKICPVMEGPIDKNIFVEYQGKKVYFCCEDCKAKFEKEPEKYVSKLPQFQK
jgi:YHS domain-containing protein